MYQSSFFWMTLALTLLIVACEEKEFSEDYDIPWPIPEVTDFTPKEALIESEVTITGVNLDQTTRVSIGSSEAQIISKSATQVVIKIPRVLSTDKIKVHTAFKRDAFSVDKFTPEFPATQVTSWPSKIVRTETFKIEGENVDLITEIKLGTYTIRVDGSKGTPGSITIGTAGLILPDEVSIVIVSVKGEVVGGSTSPSIPVEDPTDVFIPIAPLVLFDFEDNVDPYVKTGAIAEQHGINLSPLQKARNQKYFTLKATVPSGQNWNEIGKISYPQDIDLAEYHDPYLSFMINTNGTKGYFQVDMKQDGTDRGGHFVAAVSVPEDDYTFPITDGWEWRSVRLADLNSSNGGWGSAIDPKGIIQLGITFKQGNGSNSQGSSFEINVDQLMITDGPVKPVLTLFNLENNVNPYNGNGTSGINLGSVSTVVGDKFLTVKKTVTGAWDWHGEASYNQSIDLSDINRPFISFWFNTGANAGQLQMELVQDGTKWGSNPFAAEGYTAATAGEWKLYTFEMDKLFVEKWGGTGSDFNPKGTVESIKIGFSTGNQADGTYEVNIDQVMISDGPVF